MVSYGNERFNPDDKLVFETIISSNDTTLTDLNYNLDWNIYYTIVTYTSNNASISSTNSNNNNNTNNTGSGYTVTTGTLDWANWSVVTTFENYLIFDVSKDSSGVLMEDVEYEIEVIVTIDTDELDCENINCNLYTNLTGFGLQTVSMNDVPNSGNCSILSSENNESVYALTTLTTVECEGWQDNDMPLTYEFGIAHGKQHASSLRVVLWFALLVFAICMSLFI